MRFHFNNSKLKNRRQILRNNQTGCERILWSKLRNKQCRGYRFLRQFSLGFYILDFYCPKLRLAIEVDGSQHSQNIEYDKIRTNYLAAHNIIELRFWNNEVLENLDGIYSKILETIDKFES